MESSYKSRVITIMLAQASIHLNDKETVFKWGSKDLNLIESNYRTLNLILSAKAFLSLCRLLWLNPGLQGEHLTSQLSWVTP